MTRQPAVAGSFYSANPVQLSSDVDSFLRGDHKPHQVKGIIVPHAGYVYSGVVAGEVFAGIKIPELVVLIGPKHQGLGHNVAVGGVDAWATPLGDVPLAVALRDQLMHDIPELVIDDQAHQYEHSLEVMLPFLLKRQSKLKIVPIVLGHLSFSGCLNLGTALAKTLKKRGEDVLLLASSDMNHFSSAADTEKLDALAIAAMTSFDLRQLYQVVTEKHISMCGVLPTITVMQAAYDLGARSCDLVRYSHSGMVNGDNSRVVGYAGLTIE